MQPIKKEYNTGNLKKNEERKYLISIMDHLWVRLR